VSDRTQSYLSYITYTYIGIDKSLVTSVPCVHDDVDGITGTSVHAPMQYIITKLKRRSTRDQRTRDARVGRCGQDSRDGCDVCTCSTGEQHSQGARVSRCGQDSQDGCDACTGSTREQRSRGASVVRCDRYSQDGRAVLTRSPSPEMRELEEGNEYDSDSDYDSDSAQDITHAQLRELEELRAEKKNGWRQRVNHGFEEGSVFGPSVRPFSCSYVAALKSSHAQNRNPFAHTNANNNVCTLNCVCSLCARFRDVHGAWLNTSCQRRPGCKCSTCRTFFDENGKWSEVRASWSISRAPSQDWNILPVFGPWPAPGLVSQDRCAISSITTATLPCTNSARTLHNASDIYLIAAGTALVITPFGPAVESPPHAQSVAYIYSGDVKIVPTAPERGEWKSESAKCYSAGTHTAAQSGAVIDTGAQRGATGNRSEILQKTDTTLKMQPAVGPAKHMKGILMGAKTIDMHGTPFQSVFSSCLMCRRSTRACLIVLFQRAASWKRGLESFSEFLQKPM